MGDEENEVSNQDKSLTIRVKARIVGEKPCTDKEPSTNTTTLNGEWQKVEDIEVEVTPDVNEKAAFYQFVVPER